MHHIHSVQQQGKIFLITSASQAPQLLSRISHLRQIDSIFIFCMKIDKYQHLTNEYPKIIGIYNELDTLCQSIREQIDLVDQQLQTFSFYDQHQKATKDLSKQSAEFLWFQLFSHVILRLPRNQYAKQQMIDMCRQYYRGNTKELTLIDQFDRDYQTEDAIHWYTKQSFLYKLVNKALRSEDIDQLHIFRFFIGDLSESLRRQHDKILSSSERVVHVYRGAKLAREEFDQLKDNQGKLISTNGYLSTSRNRSRALAFALKKSKRRGAVGVLFEISCDVDEVGGSVIFGDIAELSEFPDEEEVLFDVSAVFQVESIHIDGEVHVVRMSASKEGEIITKDYIELTQRETEESTVAIVFGRFMCDLGEYDKSQRYFEALLKEPNGEDISRIKFNIGRALNWKGEWKKARAYYDRCYDRMMKAETPRTNESAYVLNNIGIVLDRQGKYSEALQYYEKALEIREKYYPSGHVDIAQSLHNIGIIFHQEGKYSEALDYHERALKIREQYYPSGHVNIADSLNNIGVCYKDLSKSKLALDYFQQASSMYEKFLPVSHPERVRAERNIQRITTKCTIM